MCIWGHLRHQLVVLDRLRCPQPHQLKYGRCREETQKETSLTLNETVPLTVGKGTAHLIQKAKTLLGYLREPRQLYERTKATRNSCSSCWLLFSFLLVRIMYREVFIYVYSYVVF
ncbi:uncharacterized protein LOC133800261 isoform X2 [Humulus lupulus]|uniref:uncharacterized protein LOC133800261 isoform X2 n=1 Tax=Humulus lupulus TaxID=3486 RepID=UPI002B400AB4|nr:uncharacterized protein LOC133800261 isoform X2 [Humulus lupulus]